MYWVYTYFKNGGMTRFQANKFEIELEIAASYPDRPHKFICTGLGNKEIPIYLTPNEIAGIVVLPT